MLQNKLHHFRQQLANNSSLLHFSVLGIMAGICCGLIMEAFHYLLELPQQLILPGGQIDNFEALPKWAHFALPLTSAIIIGLVMQRYAKNALRTGVPHVVHCLHSKNGRMPGRNLIVQFFIGAFALATGQSGGREGPAIHLGAGINSVIGQKLLLPNNSLRLLIGCGAAAAIAAAFNTPIAGVIFAMEVVMMEYTIAGFIPIILAAITATTVMRAIGGTDKLFLFPDIDTIAMSSLAELPYIVLLGLVVGGCAALFMMILKLGLRQAEKPIALRATLAGLITGCCALAIPEVLGIGYDSLNAILANEYAPSIIIALLIAKLIATACSVGLGLPIGLIGPNLLIGACIGGAMGILAESLFPELQPQRAFYVLIGMGAMMGAVMNAPLAALMTLIELTGNTNVIFPGMLAITVATLTHSELFKQRSATQTVFHYLKTHLRTDPMSLALQRTSVTGIMEHKIISSPQIISAVTAQALIADAKEINCIGLVCNSREQGRHYLYWQDMEPLLQASLDNHDSEIDLLAMAPSPERVESLHVQATLREAMDIMDEKDINYVYISGPRLEHGILSRKAINNHASMPQH